MASNFTYGCVYPIFNIIVTFGTFGVQLGGLAAALAVVLFVLNIVTVTMVIFNCVNRKNGKKSSDMEMMNGSEIPKQVSDVRTPAIAMGPPPPAVGPPPPAVGYVPGYPNRSEQDCKTCRL